MASSLRDIGAERQNELPGRPPGECKILLVDDDTRVVEAFSLFLANEGYQILSANAGKTALQVIAEEQPDIVVLDVMLPDLDGITVCQEIKNSPATRFLPVILVTGVAERDRRLNGLRAGADDFLDKPIDPLELTVRVRALLRTKQLYDQLEANRRDLEQRVEERTQELRDANRRLQALSEVKGNVLALVSHELRTPLHKAKQAFAVISQPSIDSDTKKQMFANATLAFEVLEFRLDEVESFSDPTDLKLTPASITVMLRGAVERIRPLRRDDVERLHFEVPRGLPPVMVDPLRMMRVLAHLIDNALKFSDEDVVEVTAILRDEDVLIAIIDHGDGISPKEIEQLFSPLRQHEPTSTRRHGGMGMGLALVKAVLDAHDIAIEFKSRRGKGTTVSFALPRARL
jgi:signal transduction histidine kinase